MKRDSGIFYLLNDDLFDFNNHKPNPKHQKVSKYKTHLLHSNKRKTFLHNDQRKKHNSVWTKSRAEIQQKHQPDTESDIIIKLTVTAELAIAAGDCAVAKIDHLVCDEADPGADQVIIT